MPAMKWQLAICLFLTFTFYGSAQTAFNVSTNYVEASKPSDYFVFYNYTELENNTDDTLQMRWVKTETICNLPNEPGTIWDIGIQDRTNFYYPANFLDSAEFYIPPVSGSTDKFLLHLSPNNQAGNLIIKFLLFPVNDPTDTVTVTFDYTATEITALSEISFDVNFKVFPNPAKEHFTIQNLSDKRTTSQLYGHAGRWIHSFILSPNERKIIDAAEKEPGVYFLRMENSLASGVKKIVILPE